MEVVSSDLLNVSSVALVVSAVVSAVVSVPSVVLVSVWPFGTTTIIMVVVCGVLVGLVEPEEAWEAELAVGVDVGPGSGVLVGSVAGVLVGSTTGVLVATGTGVFVATGTGVLVAAGTGVFVGAGAFVWVGFGVAVAACATERDAGVARQTAAKINEPTASARRER